MSTTERAGESFEQCVARHEALYAAEGCPVREIAAKVRAWQPPARNPNGLFVSLIGDWRTKARQRPARMTPAEIEAQQTAYAAAFLRALILARRGSPRDVAELLDREREALPMLNPKLPRVLEALGALWPDR